MLRPGDRIWCPRLSEVIYVVVDRIGDDPEDYAVGMRREDGKPFRSVGVPEPQMVGYLVNGAWSMENGWQLVDGEPPIRSIVIE
jgi:hypothetical protein